MNEVTFGIVILVIECFEIEVFFVTECEPLQRGIICLNALVQTADSGEMMWRG